MDLNELRHRSEGVRKKRGRQRMFTDEERKDRNRVAQAAFRAKKSEYFTCLETQNLQLELEVEELRHNVEDLKQEVETKSSEAAALQQEIAGLRAVLLSIVGGSPATDIVPTLPPSIPTLHGLVPTLSPPAISIGADDVQNPFTGFAQPALTAPSSPASSYTSSESSDFSDLLDVLVDDAQLPVLVVCLAIGKCFFVPPRYI
ncbi:hypothetical protein HK097_006003 [Rhizophlyctis rosea]|uniref:BZIP domain-containing protein n=1 Tax=Rhizophlyctis rosea TaxID=64517 RepID=A0AAD5X5B9_9FUNG|nr:hypothetical protein HK097_006003 [Rhizophlyctis rosea]